MTVSLPCNTSIPTLPLREKGKVVIIGAGIAGCTLARALAEQGVAVTVLERGMVAGAASGNAAAVLFPQLTKRWTPSAAWYFAGYDLALRQLARWQAEGLDFRMAQPGMLRLPRHAAEEAQLRTLNTTLGLDTSIVHWIEAEEASAKSGVTLATGGAWFPQGTWVAPGELCRALLQHPLITLREQTAVHSLTRVGDGWVLETDGRQVLAAMCCVTAAQESAALLSDYGVTLRGVAGQVSRVAAASVTAALRSILCHKGYVIPQGDSYLIGATYNHDAVSLAVTQANHQHNLDEVASFLPSWIQGAAMDGRMALRATTPDRLPYVGKLDEGLYVSTGHGSRGMLSAPLAAEVLAAMMTGKPVPLPEELQALVDPARLRTNGYQASVNARISSNPSARNRSR